MPYMLTGSLAGSYHGAPRATQDIDLVVDAPVGSLLALGEALTGAGLYASTDAIRSAAESRGMFNAIDPDSGWKIDFIVRKERDFSREEFEGRESIEFMGLSLSLARAEDVVIAKLEWAQMGDSERQLRDVAEIVAVQGPSLDRDRIERWVGVLSLRPEWDRVLAMVDPPTESL